MSWPKAPGSRPFSCKVCPRTPRQALAQEASVTGSSASPAKGTFQKEKLSEWTWAMPHPFPPVDTGPERQSKLPKVTEQGLEICPAR